jgi:hypothetical protein
VAEPWLAAGAITELDGKAKASGKTTLATHLVRAVLDGGPFLGRPTSRTPVVYLTEQAPPTFREALRRADLLDRDDLSVLAWHDAASAPWPDVVAAAVARAASVGAGCWWSTRCRSSRGSVGTRRTTRGRPWRPSRRSRWRRGRPGWRC